MTVPFLDFDWESLRKSIQEIEGYTHKGDHEVCKERGGGEVFHDLCFHPDSLLFFDCSPNIKWNIPNYK